MLTNPLLDGLRITDEMREGTIANAQLAADVNRRFVEAMGEVDEFWDGIEDDPLAPDAQFDEEIS